MNPIKNRKNIINFKCKTCGKEFTRNYNMKRHMNIKHEQREYDWECEELFKPQCKAVRAMNGSEVYHEQSLEHDTTKRCDQDYYASAESCTSDEE